MPASAASAPTLTLRELNRATLARQMLLARAPVSAVEAVERLAGMQAQEPKPPFTGLWTRVEGFARDDLHAALHDRSVVRATLMRATLHLLSAADYAALRPALQPGLTAGMKVLGERATGLDHDRLLSAARRLLDERPLTFNELRPRLAELFPDSDERALGYAVRLQVPLVMVPTDDRWAFPRDSAFAPAEAWIGRSLAGAASPEALVLRYLAAFGPATAADAQAWSGLKGLKAVFEVLRPELEVFADERGRELFDVPGAPRPAADAEAPPRFLPEFDNLVLAHSDRTRLLADEHRPGIVTKNLRVRATFLLDGFVAGTWTAERKRATATLRLAPFAKLAEGARKELTVEGEGLLRFVEPDATTFAVEVGGPGGQAS